MRKQPSAASSKALSPLKRLDLLDKLTLPMFAATMLAEAAALGRVDPKRPLDDLDDADPAWLASRDLPADPLVAIGYERRDTAASLSMLAGNVVIGFATAAVLDRFCRFLFRHRVSDVGSRKGAIVGAMVLWDFLYYWDHRWMHEVRLCGPTTCRTTRAAATTSRPRCDSRGPGS
jgi:hypothetical protein